MQRWKAKISSSSRFALLNNLKGTFERSRYIDTMKDPETRLIFTRLHTDMNPFLDIYGKENHWYIYLSSLHQWLWLDVLSIFECPIFDDKRNMMCNAMERLIPTWSHMEIDEKIEDLLDLKCPDNAVGTCCVYVSHEKCME